MMNMALFMIPSKMARLRSAGVMAFKASILEGLCSFSLVTLGSSLYVLCGKGHDFFLGGVLRVHFTGQPAAGHNQNPVADA